MALSEKEKRQIELEEKSKFRAQRVNTNFSQKHGLPALLSFFIPGLGQIVKGQAGRGVLIFFGTLLGFALFIIPGVIAWIWQIVDAYNK